MNATVLSGVTNDSAIAERVARAVREMYLPTSFFRRCLGMGWAFRIEEVRQRGETSIEVYLFTYRNRAGSDEGAGAYLDAVKKEAINFLKERGYQTSEGHEYSVHPRVGILFGTDLTEVVTQVHLGIYWS